MFDNFDETMKEFNKLWDSFWNLQCKKDETIFYNSRIYYPFEPKTSFNKIEIFLN